MIKIIDYKAGNAPSVMHAIEKLGYRADFARNAADLQGATHIILPGVGSAKATMDSLSEMGLLSALEQAVLHEKVLFLGICVGMQVLFDHSEEEDADCLGWLPGRVIKFDKSTIRVPQMGWNSVEFLRNSSKAPPNAAKRSRICSVTPLQKYQMPPSDTPHTDHFYFVNSYYADPENPDDVWGLAEYGGLFCAAVKRGNIYGTQFHAEKSGTAGLALLDAFLRGEA